WLRTNGPRAEVVMSVCNGALALANAGLLDGKAATCPGGNLDGLMVLGHDVRAMKGRRFVHDGNVVTCDSYFARVDGALEGVKSPAGEAAARASATANCYDWRPELFVAPADATPTPPSHDVTVLHEVLTKGVDAALADYREWEKTTARTPGIVARGDGGRFP